MNTSAQLSQHVLQRIQELEPISDLSLDGAPFHSLQNPETGDNVGSINVFQGTNILDKVVVVNIRADSAQMDAYMVMAFTRPGMLYPHLAFDTEVQAHDSAFHIDLLHKQDFSTDIPYIQSVMAPLSAALTAANENPNFRFSDATLLMKALLNPWMASYHCDPEFLPDAKGTIDAYIDHWLSLANGGTEGIALISGEDEAIDEVISAYDKAHRAALFDPRVDVLWEFLVNVMGKESRDLILKLVRGEEV